MWVRAFLPEVLIAAIPNGGTRKAKEAIKLKSEGVVAGMPDLAVLEPSGAFHGLFIEMKTQDGTVSEAQNKIHAKLKQRHYVVRVCRSFEEAKREITDYLEQAK
jgi:histidinol-phosphate/aromatic aminotransferase/cobyric acid decarboxylase-like protein